MIDKWILYHCSKLAKRAIDYDYEIGCSYERDNDGFHFASPVVEGDRHSVYIPIKENTIAIFHTHVKDTEKELDGDLFSKGDIKDFVTNKFLYYILGFKGDLFVLDVKDLPKGIIGQYLATKSSKLLTKLHEIAYSKNRYYPPESIPK